jgi:hypothetical protein
VCETAVRRALRCLSSHPSAACGRRSRSAGQGRVGLLLGCLLAGVARRCGLFFLFVVVTTGASGYWWYRRRYLLNRPETLSERYAPSETGLGAADDIFRVGYVHSPELPRVCFE